MSDATPFDAAAAKVLGGDAPLHLRSAAARGVLPLARPVLTRLQVFLLADPVADIVEQAQTSLKALDAQSAREVLSDPDCTLEVLTYFAPRAAREEALAEPIAFHPSLPVPALLVLATSGTAAVIQLVLTNEELLLSRPKLLEAVSGNPALRAEQRGRVLEILERLAKRHDRGATGSGEAPDELSLDEAARLLEVDVGELMSSSEILGGEEFESSEDPRLRSAYSKILLLNSAQKAILAMRGGREERMILVRDSNRTVALAVLRNGRLVENEVEAIARMRNVVEDVLRRVGSNREWTKSYSVICGLVNNPRTPQGIAVNFVGRLSNHDLKLVTTNKDVPELIRRMAKRLLDTRTQSTASPFKRK